MALAEVQVVPMAAAAAAVTPAVAVVQTAPVRVVVAAPTMQEPARQVQCPRPAMDR